MTNPTAHQWKVISYNHIALFIQPFYLPWLFIYLSIEHLSYNYCQRITKIKTMKIMLPIGLIISDFKWHQLWNRCYSVLLVRYFCETVVIQSPDPYFPHAPWYQLTYRHVLVPFLVSCRFELPSLRRRVWQLRRR